MTPEPDRTSPFAGSVGDAVTATGDPPAPADDLTATRDAPPPAVAIRPDPPPGFAIEKELGVGGMGAVYLATQTGLNRPVALKLVRAGEKADAKALIRFLAEAEAVASVRHPNVVEVYAYGDHQGKPYMALEYCGGGDLTALTATTPTRDADWFRRVAELMAGVAAGVQAAHAAGIVHRDLKPGNVLLTADGVPKVADFGLAKRGVGSDLTKTHAVMGTPAYMSPEQAGGGGKFVGPEADVWALGVMLYEQCGGERPFDGGNVMEVLAAVAAATVPPLRSKCPAVPADLALITHKCLQREPKDRYPTAGTLATDLRNWLDGKPISARPAGVVEQAVKWAKRNKKLAGMGLAVLLTMAAATAVSVGFGLDATAQRQKAEDAARRADEKAEDAERSNEQTQRTLARALLAPVRAEQGNLTEYEQNALWELAELRRGPVPLLLYAEALHTPLAGTQFRHRADYLDHAAVGLDSTRRREADALLSDRLRTPDLPRVLRRDLALGTVTAERYGDAAVDALASSVSTEVDDWTRLELSRKLALAVRGVPAGRAAEACGRAADALLAALLAARTDKNNWYLNWELGDGLSAVVEHLPAGKAAEVSRAATAHLLAMLRAETYTSVRREWAKAILATTRRLPADEAAAVCGAAADTLLADLREEANKDARRELAEGLAAVVERLPADKATAACEAAVEVLLADIKRLFANDRIGDHTQALLPLVRRLPTDRAEQVCRKAADLLLTELNNPKQNLFDRIPLAGWLVELVDLLPSQEAADRLLAALRQDLDQSSRGQLAVALARVAGRLPADRAEAACQAVADGLAAALTTTFQEQEEYRQLMEALAAVAERLPPEKAVALLLAQQTTTNPKALGEMAVGLARVAERLPTGRDTEVCVRTAEVLLAAAKKPLNPYELYAIAAGLSWVSPWLPEPTIEAAGREMAAVLTTALDGETDPYLRSRLAYTLTLIAHWSAPDQGKKLCGTAADVCVTDVGANVAEHATELANAVTGLDRFDRVRRQHPDAFASVLGIATQHPSGMPTPRPLPPETLVNLLKHPFCVKEARRAVLDALEFTYDRQFADLWEFVAFAEKEHPELDLLTPPERPERK